MISNELMEEIISVSNKDEFLSKGLINRIAINLVEKCDPLTKSLFQEFGFVENLWNNKTVYASCNKEEGIIYYCYEHAIGYAMAMLKENSSYLMCNLTIIEFLIHELEHLKESYKQQQNELENKLIKNCSSEFIRELIIDRYLPNILKKYQDKEILSKPLFKKYQEFYLPIWDICPDEKIADPDAYKIIVDSVGAYPNFKYTNKQDYEDIVIAYISSLLTGYKKNRYTQKYSIPLEKYLNEISKIDIHQKMDPTIKEEITRASEYTSEERMKYGLPITDEDIKQVKRKYLTKGTK